MHPLGTSLPEPRALLTWHPAAAVLLLLAPLALVGCAEPAVQEGAPGAQQVEQVTAPAAAWADLLPNARQPAPGILTGGQPTVEQLEKARDAGFTTVVNLRTAGEPGTGREDVEALGLRYVALPIDGAAGVTEENALDLARILEEAEGPVVVHCGSGNRVGALFALKAFHVEGRSAEEALEAGLEAGLTRLEPAVRERLGLAD